MHEPGFKLLVSADLHHDVPRSATPAEAFAEQFNDSGADGLLLIGDSATSDGRHLEDALGLFRNDRIRLFVPGNHELWRRTDGLSASELLGQNLPNRVTAAGWHWLPGNPWRRGDVAVVGSLGWYDHSLAAKRLGLPGRFYEAGLSPAAAKRLERDDLAPFDIGPDFFARWNDKRYIHALGRDADFLDSQLDQLRSDLDSVAGVKHVIAAVHCCPCEAMLPQVPDVPIPESKLRYAFARAFLGSAKIAPLVGMFDNVRLGFCGHSHVARPPIVCDGVTWQNIGSDYEVKRSAVVQFGELDTLFA